MAQLSHVRRRRCYPAAVRRLRIFRRIGAYYRRHALASTLGALCVVASALTGLLVPRIVSHAVDALSKGAGLSDIIGEVLLIPAVMLVAGGFLFVQRRLLVGVSRHIEHHLRVDLYDHVLRLPPSFFMSQRIGDLLTRATSDVNAVRMATGPALMYTINTVVVMIAAGALMARIDLRLTVLSLLVVPLVALVTRGFGSRIHARWGQAQEALSQYTARLQEHLVGLRVLRAYACEDAEMGTMAARNRDYVEASRRLIVLQAAFQPLLQATVGLSFAVVLGLGGNAVRTGLITLGQFVEFNLYLVRMIWPMIAVGFVVNLVQRGAASMSRIETIFDQRPLPELTGSPTTTGGTGPASLELRNVVFSYAPAAPPAVKGISAVLRPGERVALVGGVGSGKSTLLSLVPRLLEPEPGMVLIDGSDVRGIPLSRLRREVALVPQGSFLFSATLRDNIALARPEASDEDVLAAALGAGLEEDLASFPEGFDTLVGERGVTLSGGQRQRVAIARALITRPRLLLLDDCLSAVDPKTEKVILDHLPETTLLLATHRLAAAELCDTVIVLDAGRVIEHGSPHELAAGDTRYAHLLALQKLERPWRESA
jgi:ATP-binding cassette subfamily B multidrug efflux pump